MILADTPIRVDHPRQRDEVVAALLETGRVVMHPLVLGETALGNMKQRAMIMLDPANLPAACAARGITR